MNTPTYQTTIADRIATARYQWAEKLAAASMRAAQQREAARAESDRQWQQRLVFLSRWVPGWALEYVERDDEDGSGNYVRLPGCSPIRIRVANGAVNIHAVEPILVVFDYDFDMGWCVKTAYSDGCDDFDAAVEMAAGWGESWHEMTTEATRRNEQGLRPEPPAPPEPDNVDKLGELLTAYSAGKRISTGHIERDDAMIFGAGLYAIADQLRRIAAALEADRG